MFVCACDWLVSLSMKSSRSVHTVACARIPFLCKAEPHSLVCIHPGSLHSFIDGHWGCFQLLALGNDAAVNVGVQTSL